MNFRLWSKGQLPPWRRGFPFFFGKPRTAVERLRAAGSRQVWEQGPILKRLALGAAMTIGWPVVTCIDAARISARRAREGRSPFLPSFWDLYRAALTRNIAPGQGALYEAVTGLNATELAEFLLPLDHRPLQQLNSSRGAIADDVQDKARFERICRAHGLRCARTVAVFDHGTSSGENALRGWTEPLFVKALTGNRGAGAELWKPGGRGFISSTARELSADELIESLRPQNCIVQPALEDHPALRAFGTVALSNVRVVTAKGRTIPSRVIAASISLAVEPGSLTGREGFHCGIDVDDGAITGTLSPVEEDARLTDRNPVGAVLPQWSECVDLVCTAHDEAFAAFATLGWDVALTPVGPVLLETNVSWGMFGHQRLSGPLGETALSAVIDELLEPAEADRHLSDRPSKPASRSRAPVDGAGLLRGYFDTRPSRLTYDLDFIPSEGEWKPIKLNVDVKPVQSN